MGVVAYATVSNVVAVDMADGDVLWRLKIDARPLSGVAAAGDGHVLLHDVGGTLMLLDAAAGRLTHRIELADTARTGSAGLSGQRWPQLQLTDRQWHLLTPCRAQAWRYDGRPLWRDAVSTSGRSLLVQLVADQVVALAARADAVGPVADDRKQTKYRLFVLDRKGGAIRAECDLPTNGRPLDTNGGLCLDHQFVLSTADATIVVPDAVASTP